MSTATLTALTTIHEEQEQRDREPSSWLKLKTEANPFAHLSPRLARIKTCEEYVREEMASEAAMWAYLRSSGGLRRDLVAESGFYSLRKN